MAEDEQNRPPALTAGVPAETCPGELRVALAPPTLTALAKANINVVIEAGAGAKAGFPDKTYAEKGANVAARADVFSADIILQVRSAGANPEAGRQDLANLRPDQVVIGLADPLASPQGSIEVAERKATLFAMELIPRITRAQSMDALSSQANIGGYKAVLLAAQAAPKMFPMMTTAAGTVPPARVLVLGAGVAGLQAIATARRLGAVVEAYDVRPEVKEQVQSLGAKFVDVPLDTAEAAGAGGYAKEQSEDFLRRQREVMTKTIAGSDVVITTAQVPGRKAPVLVTEEMVRGMSPGSIIVDMAAGQGGNVEPSRPDETVVVEGVLVLGPTNLPATVAHHASMLYSKNISTFLLALVKEGRITMNMEDEIIRETLVCRGGDIVNARVRSAAGLEPLAASAEPETATSPDGAAGAGASGVPTAAQ